MRIEQMTNALNRCCHRSLVFGRINCARYLLVCWLSVDVCQELQELVNQQLNVIQQTSNALNQCCHGNSAFAGSAEAVECHRLLLVACESSLHSLLRCGMMRNYHCVVG